MQLVRKVLGKFCFFFPSRFSTFVYDPRLLSVFFFPHGQITGNLVKSKLKVAEPYIHVLPMNTQVTVEGVTVVLLEANQ